MPDKTAITNAEDSKPVDNRVESDASSLEQMLTDTKSLSEDVGEWLRLKVQLIRIEIHQMIRDETNAVLTSLIVLGLLMVSFLIGMMAVGLFLGEILGSFAYGFGIVAGSVAILALVLGRMQPQWMGEAMFFLVPLRWMKRNTSKNEDNSDS